MITTKGTVKTKSTWIDRVLEEMLNLFLIWSGTWSMTISNLVRDNFSGRGLPKEVKTALKELNKKVSENPFLFTVGDILSDQLLAYIGIGCQHR